MARARRVVRPARRSVRWRRLWICLALVLVGALVVYVGLMSVPGLLMGAMMRAMGR